MAHIKRICLHVILLIAGLTAVRSQTLTSGNVLQLDGNGDYMASDTTPTNFGTGSFTAEAWIKTSNGGGVIVSSRNSDSYANFFTFFLDGAGKLALEISQDGSGSFYTVIVGTGTVNNGAWRHVALVRNGTDYNFYIDGVLDKTTNHTAVNLNNSQPFYVGGRGGGVFGMLDFFTGMIDDVRLWSVARSQGVIAAEKNAYVASSESGLVANYRFDESSGSTAFSEVSSTHNGTIYGNAQFASTPLPVELTSFTASAEDRTVFLRWNTATEQNNLGFEIERRTVGAGTINKEQWSTAGFAEGHGTTNAPQSYSFIDRSASGTIRYRLKQVDRDGKFTYSPEVEVTVGGVPSMFALEQNFPNPFNPSTSIGFTLHSPGFTSLKVYDAVGREVATLVNENLEAGVYHHRTFDASKLSSGIYIARLTSSGEYSTRKMFLVK